MFLVDKLADADLPTAHRVLEALSRDVLPNAEAIDAMQAARRGKLVTIGDVEELLAGNSELGL